MRTIITREALKLTTARVRLCCAIAAAVASHRAPADEKTRAGRAAQLRIGRMALATIRTDNAKVPFANIDGMLNYVNTSKQLLNNILKNCHDETSMIDAWTVAAYRDLVCKGLKAIDAFAEAWKDEASAAA